MTFTITMVRDEDGTFVVECPAIPAEANIRAAIHECIEVRQELGLPLTICVRQVEVAV